MYVKLYQIPAEPVHTRMNKPNRNATTKEIHLQLTAFIYQILDITEKTPNFDENFTHI
jgi:hypothetical protein